MSRYQIDDQRVRELCMKGLSNRQIAERMGKSMEVVQNARKRLGLRSVPGACDAVITPSSKLEAPAAGDTNCG